MKTYPIKKMHNFLIPFGTKAGLPCILMSVIPECEPLTPGQAIERLQEFSSKELLIVGDDPAEIVDYEFLCVLRNHGYTITMVTNGQHPLSFGLGMIDHVIVVPEANGEISVELAHDLIVHQNTNRAKEDFDNLKYSNGFIFLQSELVIGSAARDLLLNDYPNWRFCTDITTCYQTFQ